MRGLAIGRENCGTGGVRLSAAKFYILLTLCAASVAMSLYAVRASLHASQEQSADLPLLLGAMQKLQDQINAAEESQKSAVVSMDGAGYAVAPTPYGGLPVSFDKAEPHLGGTKVYVTIANPLVAKLTRLYASVEYGNREPQVDIQKLTKNGTDPNWSIAKHKEWKESIRTKSIELADSLEPGRWNRVSFVLPDIEPKDFGFLKLRLTPAALSLLPPQ